MTKGDKEGDATPVVVFVDDNVPLRAVFAKSLRMAGYDVLEACDGVGAIEHLDASCGGCCVLVTDWEMPRMNGEALLRAVRSDPRFRNVPVVIATGTLHVDADSDVPVLQKPYTVAELLAAIERVRLRVDGSK